MSESRMLPNILVTGTPGTGKTTFSDMLSVSLDMKHINVSEFIKEKCLHAGYDEEFDCYYLDEDKLCDELESSMEKGGIILDFHSCDFFPERWFDMVVVLRTTTTLLYDRLVKRDYSQKKITENMECEIMQVSLDEARSSYREEIIQVMTSDRVEQMEANVMKLQKLVEEWIEKSNSNRHQ